MKFTNMVVVFLSLSLGVVFCSSQHQVHISRLGPRDMYLSGELVLLGTNVQKIAADTKIYDKEKTKLELDLQRQHQENKKLEDQLKKAYRISNILDSSITFKSSYASQLSRDLEKLVKLVEEQKDLLPGNRRHKNPGMAKSNSAVLPASGVKKFVGKFLRRSPRASNSETPINLGRYPNNPIEVEEWIKEKDAERRRKEEAPSIYVGNSNYEAWPRRSSNFTNRFEDLPKQDDDSFN